MQRQWLFTRVAALEHDMRALLLVATLLALARGQSSCQPGGDAPTAAALATCNVSCAWCTRDHASLDFVCCEDGNWIGTHLTNPLFFYLVWADAPATIIVVFAAELGEVAILALAGSFGALFRNERDAETLAASLLGDVLVQGGLGLVLGLALRALTLAPPLVPSVERAGARVRRRYALVYAAAFLGDTALAVAVLAATDTDAGEDPPGSLRLALLAQTALKLAFIGLVYPTLTATAEGRTLFAAHGGGQPWHARTLFFLGWGVLTLASHVPHLVVPVARNEWYPQWALMLPLTIAVLLALVAVSVRSRRDYYTASLALAACAGICSLAAAFAFALDGRRALALAVLAGLSALAALVAFAWATYVHGGARVALEGAARDNTLAALEYVHATAARRVRDKASSVR